MDSPALSKGSKEKDLDQIARRDSKGSSNPNELPKYGDLEDAVFGEVREDGPNYRNVCHWSFSSAVR